MEIGVYCRGYIQYETPTHEELYLPRGIDYKEFKEQRSITKYYFFAYDFKNKLIKIGEKIFNYIEE